MSKEDPHAAALEIVAGRIARAPGAPVVLDIGAADGADTVLYAKRFPAARVLAFEPLSFNVEEVRRAIDANGLGDRVEVLQLALSDREGNVDFWVSGGEPPAHLSEGLPSAQGPRGWRYSSSMLEPHEHKDHWPWVTFERETVAARRLDTIAAQEGISRIDFAHLDVQGAELAVLRGMGTLLETVGAVWLEVSNAEMYRGQPLRAEVEDFMRRHGFDLAIDATRRKPQGNQLWTRSG